jgi:hypothetical protein
MPRLRVIILDQEDTRTYRFVLWADAPLARQTFYADPAAGSVWKNALPSDVAAIQAGQVVERAGTLILEPGEGVAVARTLLQASWQAFQNEITTRNPWGRYGTTWDGTTWVAGGVA